ncbi:succinylglutamate desuccinylase/aspartoacylase family protein [Methylobacillus arboreus]|uniref:succinylglutamate desuccinylase/aspartoacylase domain-containing protein n=1 Tax=Methylobacillus arboreus TaxID=755170 RepID=UPI001E5D0DA4|nr:succinylglutamate desuccinylase/aspartoacylase family protein [Methylobacillus arboreus]MCB5189758.1 succinylglutamate desuccinylase/aspartoacylase family protein [Methylobacillus arboreus]
MSYHFQSISFSGMQPGKRLIVLGGVHGNEPCGTLAISRVINDIEDGRLDIAAGEVTFVPVCNPLAREQYSRGGERNLNRKLFPTDNPQQFEDYVANWLCPLLADHDVLLDLHSFHTPGEPFAMLGPKNNQGSLEPFAHDAEEEALARHLGVKLFVDGWLDTYASGVTRRQGQSVHETPDADVRYGVGTTEYMRSQGGYGLTLECGQHEDASAPEVAYQAILNTLAWLGLSGNQKPEETPDRKTLRLFEVVDKVDPADSLAREWQGFECLSAGTLIGTRASGEEIRAVETVHIVFPNPHAEPGSEWFYLARPVERV